MPWPGAAVDGRWGGCAIRCRQRNRVAREFEQVAWDMREDLRKLRDAK